MCKGVLIKRYLISIFFIFCALLFFSRSGICEGIFDIKHRPPAKNQYLYDYANILTDVSEYSNRYLKGFKDRYSIETVIVTLPFLNGEEDINKLAVELLNNWKIGADCNKKGLLLLLVAKEKQVKLEVAYELEDVFTDMFCGYIEDLQLRPYFFSNQISVGFLAVMEEIEKRAQIKIQGGYTTGYIGKLDGELLSGGGGAKRDLSKFKKENINADSSKYPAGETPSGAWQILIQSWRDKARPADLGVYTEITKLIYRDYQDLPDVRYEKNVRVYADKPYEVIQNDSCAVIFFGNKEGWDNSPFLFCKTEQGWQYDLVHQRKYIRMGENPYWGIERGNYPYVDFLKRCSQWMNQDIPLEGEDIYRIENDKRLADGIVRLEAAYNCNSGDFDTLMELCRLYTVTSMGVKTISLLKQAKQLNPISAAPYKYLAIVYVDTNYQYKSAIEELKEYVKREPKDVFGRNFLGYLFYCIGDYERAIKEFNQSINLRPDNCYAYCKLSRCYGQLYLSALESDLRRSQYKKLALEMMGNAKTVSNVDSRRIDWLESWLLGII